MTSEVLGLKPELDIVAKGRSLRHFPLSILMLVQSMSARPSCRAGTGICLGHRELEEE